MQTDQYQLTIVHFASDAWEHVCPVIRVLGPARQAGWPVIQGNAWEEDQLVIFPERVAQADLVIIQRDFPRHAEAYDRVITAAREHHKVVIYELDDLLIELPSVHPDYTRYMSTRPELLKAIIDADVVTCSTPRIQEYLRDFNSDVRVIPNYLNDNLWTLRPPSDPATPPSGDPVTIGYLGSHSHQPDLAMVAPLLADLLDHYGTQLRIRLWGIAPPLPLTNRENVEWLDIGLVDYAEFAAYFSRQECDLFIAPLSDNLFNRSKSWIKFLEYSALGVPGIYAHLPPYEQVVLHGENGLLATTLEEWENCLVQLIENPELRLQMGSAAQQTLHKHWLLSDHVNHWCGQLEEIYNASPHRSDLTLAQRIASKFAGWHREERAAAEVLHDEIDALDQTIRDFQSEVSEKDHLIQIYADQLEAIRGSTGWRLLEILYAIRLALIPRESRRERSMHIGIHSLRILKNEGIRSLGSNWVAMLRSRDAAILLGDSLIRRPRPTLIQEGQPCPSPAISVVLEETPLLPALDREAVRKWAEQQTLRAIEVVIWARENGRAWVMDVPVSVWEATDLPGLCRRLEGRYICMASQDLLSQPETYLEANLAALECEALIFTVNTLGDSGWATRNLHLGLLPGDRLRPLFRMLARKEFIAEDYSLQLSPWVEKLEGFPTVIGRVISHTTQMTEIGDAFPLQTNFGSIEAVQRGSYILARAREEPWEAAVSLCYACDSVLPPAPEHDKRPTVFVVLQFLALGGAEQLALHILSHLSADIRFVVISVDPLDPGLGTLTDAFREITPWVYNLPDFIDPSLRSSFLWYLIDRFDPVSLYIANGAAWIYDVLPDLKSRHPQIQTINQVYDSQVGWINRYDLSLILSLDAHIGANHRICQAYIERGVEPEHVHLVEHGIDPSNLNPQEYTPEKISRIRQKFGLKDGQQVVTFASRIHPQKRPLDFIELARRMASDPSLVFLMMGDGPLASVVDEQIAQIGLQNFHRHPFYRPISDVLAISDVVVLPSEYEGMPLIVAEAQIMGKPVVVTDVGNNREVLDISGGGVVIPQIGDVTALMGGVLKMLQTPPDPVQIREAILAHYGIEVIARKYCDILLGEDHA